MLLGLMFTLPRYAGLGATQPANLGKLVTPERDWREKPPLMSDWRRRRGRRLHSKRPVRAWQGLSCLRALAAQDGPSIAKQAGMFMFGRHAARRAIPGHRGRSHRPPAHRS